ncbi:MAG: hypothetical protein AAF633_27555, partial [Chloroflexota bacterium]
MKQAIFSNRSILIILFAIAALSTALYFGFPNSSEGKVYAASKAIQPQYTIFPEGYSEGAAQTIFEQDLLVQN